MNVIKSAVFVMLSLFVFTQGKAQIQFGAKAGLNISNIGVVSENDDDDADTNMLLRYHLGATANYDINDKFSFQPSLLFSIKGFSVNNSQEDDFSEISQKGYGSFYYLDIPVHLAYKINNFQIYAGPYAAFGIGGRGKSEVTSSFSFGGQTIEESETTKGSYKPYYREITQDDEFEDDQSAYNGFDYGLNAGVGYKMNNLLFNVGYSYGLGNWVPRVEGDDSRNDYKIQNRVINFSVSYFFGE